MKELQDSLLSLNKAKELYHKTCRDLEVAEYLKKEDVAAQVSAQNLAKRDKKLAKCHADVADAETAYRNAIEETKAVQRRYYDEQLPRMLDSLQVVYHSRLQKIQECMTTYTSEVSQVLEGMSPIVVDTSVVCKEFNLQQEIEEYIAKSESFFRMPADPVFEQFIRTPEGQVPPSLSMQQKLANKFHLRKSEKSIVVAPESGSSGTTVAYAAPTGLLGMTPEEMMEAQKTKYPLLKVPYVLVFLADCILKYGGPTADGIFRISGSLTAMEGIKEHFNKGEYVTPRDVHDSSALFKFILRSFPESLVPTSLYEEAINENYNSYDVFNKIPEPSRTVAGFVIRYLRENYLSDECVKATQMGADNIATVFFPCFIKNPSSDLQEIMKHMDQEKMWVKKCLLHLDVSSYPTLAECIAASAPAPVSVPTPISASTSTSSSSLVNKPSEEAAATQRAKALPMKPLPNPKPHPPQEAAAAAAAAEDKPTEPEVSTPKITKPLPVPKTQPAEKPAEESKPPEQPETKNDEEKQTSSEETGKDETKEASGEETTKDEEKKESPAEEPSKDEAETKEKEESSPITETKTEEEGGAFDDAGGAFDGAAAPPESA